MATMIIPADVPAYVPVGGNVLMLRGEFSRQVPVTCVDCGHSERFKLIADEILTDDQCDELLSTHLREHGWHVDDDDQCPGCNRRGYDRSRDRTKAGSGPNDGTEVGR